MDMALVGAMSLTTGQGQSSTCAYGSDHH